MRIGIQRVTRTARAGFTLVEVCIVLAIVVILVALVGSAFGEAKQRSQGSDEISRLRQLGIAAQLYEDQSGAWPLGTPTLVRAGLAPESLLTSPLDDTKGGWANEAIEHFKAEDAAYLTLATSYRRSFVGPYDYAESPAWFREKVLGSYGAGWLVSFNGSTANPPSALFIFPQGSYSRLLMDGSVLHRNHRYSETKLGRTWKVASLFTDDDKDEPEN